MVDPGSYTTLLSKLLFGIFTRTLPLHRIFVFEKTFLKQIGQSAGPVITPYLRGYVHQYICIVGHAFGPFPRQPIKRAKNE